MAKNDRPHGFGAPPPSSAPNAELNSAPKKANAVDRVQNLAIRAKASMGKGMNKPAIVGVLGGAAVLVLALSVSGLSARPNANSETPKPLMSDPARSEMAQGGVRDLPKSYEDAARFAPVSVAMNDVPQLGPAMAGDIAAFAPGNYDAGIDPVSAGMRVRAPGSTAPNVQSAVGAQVDEAEAARTSGLFFQLRDKFGGATAIVANPALDVENADRDLMTSPHRLLAAASTRSLHPGAIIPASLLTAINSDTPGPVIAQVTGAVYDSASGEKLLIPQGAKLIGVYKSSSQYGQRRIAIIWSRLVYHDGSQIILNEMAADSSGAAGLNGKVDNHWGKAFSAAILGTLINVGAAATEDRNSVGVTYSGIGVINGDDPVEEAARRGVQRTANSFSNRVIDRGLSVPPTIRIKAGAKVSVLVTRELVL